MTQVSVTITLEEKAYAALKAQAEQHDQTLEEWLSARLSAAAEDQAWYWAPEWQAAEHEAEEELRAGRYKDFRSMEELLADLDEP
jgi:hypothetical protein